MLPGRVFFAGIVFCGAFFPALFFRGYVYECFPATVFRFLNFYARFLNLSLLNVKKESFYTNLIFLLQCVFYTLLTKNSNYSVLWCPGVMFPPKRNSKKWFEKKKINFMNKVFNVKKYENEVLDSLSLSVNLQKEYLSRATALSFWDLWSNMLQKKHS